VLHVHCLSCFSTQWNIFYRPVKKIIDKTLVPVCVMRIILTPFTGAIQDTGHVQLHDGFGCVIYVKLVEK